MDFDTFASSDVTEAIKREPGELEKVHQGQDLNVERTGIESSDGQRLALIQYSYSAG